MKYISDKPCKAGHYVRYEKSNECVECRNIASDVYHNTRTEEDIRKRRERQRGFSYLCSTSTPCKYRVGGKCTAHGNTKCNFKLKQY